MVLGGFPLLLVYSASQVLVSDQIFHVFRMLIPSSKMVLLDMKEVIRIDAVGFLGSRLRLCAHVARIEMFPHIERKLVLLLLLLCVHLGEFLRTLLFLHVERHAGEGLGCEYPRKTRKK
eukprot:NODE_5759_length_640_cov_20.006768_g5368_i0.p1 GENE.NODE_5759_length_640_cov_20.006768_g5368_i0~~NODE_5759_length_640_cov_20.006768_g5368_i0.p1  ORF type:complete len:119 (-),score=7.00 NODE_5759_length_640_cov_20.006768_g5368_i0:76-432(-)